jgi:hypothetical protein
MRIDSKTVFLVLEYIELSGLSGVEFDNSADQAEAIFGSISEGNTTRSRLGISRDEREGYLDHLFETEFISGQKYKNGFTNLKLTAKGHDYLSAARKNTLLRRLARFLAKQVDRVFGSIVLPVVAAVITVLVMNYFGLTAPSEVTP